MTSGTRVELHPATDLWMRGARYGTVRVYAHPYVWVNVDKLNKEVKFHIDDVKEIP